MRLKQENAELRLEVRKLKKQLARDKAHLELVGPEDATLRRWLMLRPMVDPQNPHEILKGLKGCRIVVETVKPDSPISREEIQDTVEFQFRKAGVPILDKAPYLYVQVSTLISGEGARAHCVYTIYVTFNETCTSNRALRSVYGATTWKTPHIFGIVPKGEAREILKETVAEMTDKFLNDFLKANPKR